MQVREKGGAVLLISEDIDELLELADRIVVMSEGRIVYETDAATAERHVLGAHMGGGEHHHHGAVVVDGLGPHPGPLPEGEGGIQIPTGGATAVGGMRSAPGAASVPPKRAVFGGSGPHAV